MGRDKIGTRASTKSKTKKNASSNLTLTITDVSDSTSDSVAQNSNTAAAAAEQSVPDSILNVLLEMRNNQVDMQEQIAELKNTNSSSTVVQQQVKLPDFGSKALSKQFVTEMISSLQKLKSVSSADSKSSELWDMELTKIRSRNAKLVMADKFPGSLSILDSLQELSELKKDPLCGPFVAEAIQLSSGSQSRGGRPFSYRGRGRGAPYQYQQGYQYQGYQNQGYQNRGFQPPAYNSSPYYANQQQGMVLYSGFRQPRRVIGPCHSCQAFGHLQRDCPQNYGYNQFRGQYRNGGQQGFSGNLQAITAPPEAIVWPSGSQAGTSGPQK